MKGRAPRELARKTIPQLKKTLDGVMSKWVRRNWSSDGEYVKCFTCDVVKPIKEMHSGHYIPRTKSPTRYDDRNQRPQCPSCNTFHAGMSYEFRRRLCDEIGQHEVRLLEDLANQPWKWSRDYLIARIEQYRDELAEME